MTTDRRDATWVAGAIGAITGVFSVSSAAPPSKGGPPPEADVAYLSLSYKDNWGNPTKASVRGMAITAAGTAASDAELWRSATRTSASIAWDPSGAWLAWFQESDTRGTPSIAVATPGPEPITAYVFSAEFLWTTKLSDAVAWGPGCDANPVLYFMGNKGPTLAFPTLWVMDPFVPEPQPQELYATAGSVSGLAVSPLGRFVALGDFSAAFGGGPGIVALPLTCATGNALPTAAGPAQPLFALRYDEDLGYSSGLDWSRDGQRLALAMGRRVPNAGGSLLYDPELWTVELNYFVESGSEQVTFESVQHFPSGPVSFPSWAPGSGTAACDRLAFVAGGVQLLDVPRPGFTAVDCVISTPTVLGGKSVAAMDWK